MSEVVVELGEGVGVLLGNGVSSDVIGVTGRLATSCNVAMIARTRYVFMVKLEGDAEQICGEVGRP